MDIQRVIDTFKAQCMVSKTEDDIKREINLFMAKIGEHYQIEIASSNERTSAHGGRADSIYNDVIVELKKLRLFSRKNREGINEALWGRDERDHGLYHYLINFSLESCHDDEHILYNLCQHFL